MSRFLAFLAIVLLAFLIGVLFGWRASVTFGAEPYVPPSPGERFAFRAFEIPDPTLPASCCQPDVRDYAIPVDHPAGLASAPGSASPVPPPARRDTAASVSGGQGRHHFRLRGYATWYAARGLVASAGPALRKALGPGWRGSRVLVVRGLRAVEVRIVGWCACGKRHGLPTLLDLSPEAFRALAPLSAGVILVHVEGFR